MLIDSSVLQSTRSISNYAADFRLEESRQSRTVLIRETKKLVVAREFTIMSPSLGQADRKLLFRSQFRKGKRTKPGYEGSKMPIIAFP